MLAAACPGAVPPTATDAQHDAAMMVDSCVSDAATAVDTRRFDSNHAPDAALQDSATDRPPSDRITSDAPGADLGHAADAALGTRDAGSDDRGAMFVAVTFNTGIHPSIGSNGFTAQQSSYLDTYYGHGLAWGPAIAQAAAFFQRVQPDVVAFQEIFDVEQCASIPVEARQGFVCETWSAGGPTVAELILGPGFQLACNYHNSDKCLAVRTSFGAIEGCTGSVCHDGLAGSAVVGCGAGSRVGRGVVQLASGDELTVVGFHGSSGATDDDIACRVAQVDQVFIDLGDGTAAANGARNLVLGDFNTDPRSPSALLADSSARRWNNFVGVSKPFTFLNEHLATYHDVFCIDNVVSDALAATCWYPGFDDGGAPVSPEGYFDHTPTVCNVAAP